MQLRPSQISQPTWLSAGLTPGCTSAPLKAPAPRAPCWEPLDAPQPLPKLQPPGLRAGLTPPEGCDPPLPAPQPLGGARKARAAHTPPPPSQSSEETQTTAFLGSTNHLDFCSERWDIWGRTRLVQPCAWLRALGAGFFPAQHQCLGQEEGNSHRSPELLTAPAQTAQPRLCSQSSPRALPCFSQCVLWLQELLGFPESSQGC